jgi:dyslexia susceptibility 1 candidate gene 1 protein
VKFTERVYPHLAAREQQFKDPPMPRPKKGLGKGEDLEQRNPLFMKDKADRLFMNNDFFSAVNAYSEVVRLDPECVPARANRALCHMRLFNYEEAIADCHEVLSLLKTKKD